MVITVKKIVSTLLNKFRCNDLGSFLCACILLILYPSFAQQKIDSGSLKKDLTIIKDITLGLSPKLTEEGRQRANEVMETKKFELSGDSLTVLEFFNFISEIDLETQFDEHASLSITEEVMIPLLTNSKLFPLPIKLVAGQMVVDSEDTELPYGAMVHTINAIPVDSVLRTFTPEYQDTFIQRSIENQFSMILLIKKGDFETYDIVYTTSDNPYDTLQKTIAGIGFDKYRTVFKNSIHPLNYEQLSNLINTHHFEEENAYYLQLNSFDADSRDSKKGFFDFMTFEHKILDKKFKAVFKEIDKLEIEHLIIDLRYNGGGNVKAPGVLYSYLAEQSFTETIQIEIQDFDIPYEQHIVRISSDEVSDQKEVNQFKDRYEKLFVKRDSVYVWSIAENEIRQPSPYAFKGKVYVLISGRSISATAYFAALFKFHNRGLLVGEQMGGTYTSLTAGQMLTYQLPHSKIEFTVPIMIVNFADDLFKKLKEERINPDLSFSQEEAYHYFLNKEDLETSKVLELIRQ